MNNNKKRKWDDIFINVLLYTAGTLVIIGMVLVTLQYYVMTGQW